MYLQVHSMWAEQTGSSRNSQSCPGCNQLTRLDYSSQPDTPNCSPWPTSALNNAETHTRARVSRVLPVQPLPNNPPPQSVAHHPARVPLGPTLRLMWASDAPVTNKLFSYAQPHPHSPCPNDHIWLSASSWHRQVIAVLGRLSKKPQDWGQDRHSMWRKKP